MEHGEMRSSLTIGRFGRLLASLHYAWLSITLSGLCRLAFLWLPTNYQQCSVGLYRLTAALVMGLQKPWRLGVSKKLIADSNRQPTTDNWSKAT
jgi:hypothetical protein